jgi:transposase
VDYLAGGEKLSKRREMAIAIILQESTMQNAARKIGISYSTLWRWLQQPDFQRALKSARKQAVSQATSTLSRICHESVLTLQEIMNDKNAPASARVSAAKTVLDSGLKGIEMDDLDARLAALEQEMTEGKGISNV